MFGRVGMAFLALIAVAAVNGQVCYLGGESFYLPTVGLPIPLKYGQHLNSFPGVDGQRFWQMSFCEAISNPECANEGLPSSAFIYSLGHNESDCETAFNVQTTFWTFAALNGQPAITATFANSKGNRVAVVTIGCGNTTELLPVNAPDNNPGNPGYPGWDVNATDSPFSFTFYLQFTTSSLPDMVCSTPFSTLAPPTPAPPTPAPAATALCTLEGQSFTLPIVGLPSLLRYGQYVEGGLYPALDQQRTWQMTFCAPNANTLCNRQFTDSYIYELNGNGTECGIALANQTSPWNVTQLNGLPAITATYASASGREIAVVTIGCGSSVGLTPVNAAGIPNGSAAFPGWELSVDERSLVFTIYPKFTTSSIPFGLCSV